MARTSLALESGIVNETSQLERGNNEMNDRTQKCERFSHSSASNYLPLRRKIVGKKKKDTRTETNIFADFSGQSIANC